MPDDNSNSARGSDARNWLYDLILAYAIGNIVMLPFWFIAFARNGMPLDGKFIEHYYELSQIFDHVDYFAALLWGLIFTAVLFVVLRLAVRYSSRFYDILIAVFTIPPIAGAAAIAYYIVWPPSGHARLNYGWVVEGFIVMAAVIAVILIGLFLRGRSVLGFVRGLVTVTAPIGIVMTINAYVAYEKIAPIKGGVFHVDRTLAPMRETVSETPRVIVIFFDYWDYHYTFVKHPDFVKTPNLAKLIDVSFIAHNVARTSSKTFTAIPSTLSGHRIDYAKRIAGDRLLTQYAAEYYPRIWHEQETMFSDARETGYNVGVVATAFHPVCRMFPQYISRCVIDDHPYDYEFKTVFNRLDDVIHDTLWQVPPIRRVLFGERKKFHSHWGIHLKLSNINSLIEMSTDRDISFVYSHLFLPHAPNIWNSIKKEYMYENEDEPINYFHSIVFLDKVIGRLRRQLEASGLWEETALVLTADTGNVGSQAGNGKIAFSKWGHDKKNRVPLIIHLPGDDSRFDLNRRVSAQTLRPVVKRIMSGDLTRHDQIGEVMEYVDYMY